MMRSTIHFTLFTAVVLAVALVAPAQVRRQSPPRTTQVYIEDSPAARELIDQADRLVEQDRLTDAVNIYQRVIEQYPRKLVLLTDSPTSQKIYRDAADHVRSQVASNTQLLSTYRKLLGPVADRLLEQATAGQVDIRALDDLLTRYQLTDAAWSAALQLAGYYLERGQPLAAVAVLDLVKDHPNASRDAVTWYELKAAGALFADLPDEYANLRKSLELLQSDEALENLNRWAKLYSPVRTVNPQQSATIENLPDPLGQPLWELPIASVNVFLDGELLEFEDRAQTTRDPKFSIIPVIHRQRLYANDNWSIWALDRLSGRRIWRYTFVSDEQIASTVRARGNVVNLRTAGDARGVCLLENNDQYLVAVVGDNRPGTAARNVPDGINPSQLVCLDVDTGEVRWQISPVDLDETLDEAYFHSTPISHLGLVYTTLHRRHPSGFHDALVAAIDSRTGKLVWKRYLASMASSYRNMSRPGARMMFNAGRLYINTHLGAAACLDARTGNAHWITVLPDPLEDDNRNQSRQQLLERWRLSDPVLIPAGLVIPPATKEEYPLLFDPADGRVVRNLDDEVFRQPYRIVPAGENILLVGPTLRMLDGTTLDLLWQTHIDSTVHTTAIGEVAMTDNEVILATDRHLHIYNLTTGQRIATWLIETSGNIALADGQVIVAGDYNMRSYMRWQLAYQGLSKQMAEAPTDPGPGLALAHAGLRAGKTIETLEGIDHALDALRLRQEQAMVDLDDPLQPKVFDQLLQFAHPDQATDADLIHSIFNRIAQLTANINDEARYHLAYGSFLAQVGQSTLAVDHFQTILLDSKMTECQVDTEAGLRQAGHEADRRLTDVVDAAPRAYAKYEQIAMASYNQLQLSGSTDTAAYVELANRYPLAGSAGNSLLTASKLAADRGNTAEALTYLRQAYKSSSSLQSPASARIQQQVVGEIVTLYDSSGKPSRAAQWLLRAKRDNPHLQPLRDGKPMDVDLWLAELSSRPDPEMKLPSLGTQLGHPVYLPGRLLLPVSQPRHQWPSDYFLTYDNRNLRMFTAGSKRSKWQSTVEDRDLQLLSVTEEQVLLWLNDNKKIWAVDTQTGKPAWPPIDIDQQLEQVANVAAVQVAPDNFDQVEVRVGPNRQIIQNVQIENNQRVIIEQMGGNRMMMQVNRVNSDKRLVAANDMVFVIADFNGRVVVIDRQTGQVLWRMQCPFRNLMQLAVDDQALVLIGTERQQGGRQTTGCMFILDPITGDENLMPIRTDQPIRWFTFAGDSRMIYAAINGPFVARRLSDGAIEWERDLTSGVRNIYQMIHADSKHLIVLDDAGINVFDAATGRMQNQFSHTSNSQSDYPEVQHTIARTHIVCPEQAITLDDSGRTIWRDQIISRTKHLTSQLLGENHIAVINDLNPAPPVQGVGLRVANTTNNIYFLHFLDRTTGRLVNEYALGPIPRPLVSHQGLVLNQAIVLGTQVSTIVIPTKP